MDSVRRFYRSDVGSIPTGSAIFFCKYKITMYRIITLRKFGKLAFATVASFVDSSRIVEPENIQVSFQFAENSTCSIVTENFADVKNLSVGSIVSLNLDNPYLTNAGQTTYPVISFFLHISPTVGFPDKWHGMTDVESRYRQRYLDLMLNSKQILIDRFHLIRRIREHFYFWSFIEVDTPTLQPHSGGAVARPFTTHFNDLNADFHLRIAPELYLKRLLISGFSRIFEIGKSFRNESLDSSHVPEFMMLEAYEIYAGRDALDYLIHRVSSLLFECIGERPCQYINFSDIDVDEYVSRPENENEFIFIKNFPSETFPLAKDGLAFDCYLNGLEVASGYVEENDAAKLAASMKAYGNGEIDESFIKAMEYGMPPTVGMGVGIDRLLMAVNKMDSIKEVLTFPIVKLDK